MIKLCQRLWHKQICIAHKRQINVNSDATADDMLFKIKPIIEAVKNNCVKIKPEEYQSIDKQIIASKTCETKIRKYNPKK